MVKATGEDGERTNSLLQFMTRLLLCIAVLRIVILAICHKLALKYLIYKLNHH